MARNEPLKRFPDAEPNAVHANGYHLDHPRR